MAVAQSNSVCHFGHMVYLDFLDIPTDSASSGFSPGENSKLSTHSGVYLAHGGKLANTTVALISKSGDLSGKIGMVYQKNGGVLGYIYPIKGGIIPLFWGVSMGQTPYHSHSPKWRLAWQEKDFRGWVETAIFVGSDGKSGID